MREYQTRELFRLVRFWLENYIKKASDRPTDAAGAKRAPCCTVEPTGSGRDRVKVCIKVSELQRYLYRVHMHVYVEFKYLRDEASCPTNVCEIPKHLLSQTGFSYHSLKHRYSLTQWRSALKMPNAKHKHKEQMKFQPSKLDEQHLLASF